MCFACHSESKGKIKGDLDLTSRELMLLGGETSDRVLIPGDSKGSLLVQAIEWKDPEYEMPPKKMIVSRRRRLLSYHAGLISVLLGRMKLRKRSM